MNTRVGSARWLEEARGIAGKAVSLLDSRHSDLLEDGENRPSLYLAHYTSLDALISMLQDPDGGLRLSDSGTMNDPDEGQTTKDDRMFANLLEEQFGEESWLRRRYRSAHIGCFVGVARGQTAGHSERKIASGDDLLFWRLYGNDCRGVSITIPPHRSEELMRSALVQRVIYQDEPPLQTDLTAISGVLRDLDDLRRRAMESGVWKDVAPVILPVCDRLCAQRFLHKRAHYEMECEYRAVLFVDEEPNELEETFQVVERGMHVQYGLVRTFVQVAELTCRSILVTNSHITIGHNVSESEDAALALSRTLRDRGLSSGAVDIRISKIPYRPR